jgi:hypothetical protein
MQIGIKRKLAIGTTVLAAAAFAGGAYAARNDSPESTRQAFLNDVAKRLNVAPAKLTAALRGAFFDQLDAAVAAGKLTKTQADAIKQRIQQSGKPPLGIFGPLGLVGSRAFGRPRFFGARGPGTLPAAAKYLGLGDMQLLDQLRSGKSLAQIAKSQGKSSAGLKDAMTAAIRAKLEKARAARMITSTQEHKLLARRSAVLDREINRSGAGPRFGPRGYFRQFGSQRGPGLSGSAGAAASPAAGAGGVPSAAGSAGSAY